MSLLWVRFHLGCPTSAHPRYESGKWTVSFHSLSRHCCCLTLKVSLLGAPSLPSTATSSMSGRNFWVLEAQIYSSPSDRAIRWPAVFLNPRSTRRQEPRRLYRSSSPQ